MTQPTPPGEPQEGNLHALTDADRDDLGWERDQHGLMIDYATADEPETVPWNSDTSA